jgi:hypothetical protein
MTVPTRVPVRTRTSADLIRAEEPVLAHNYHPLPVVVARAEGTWVEDVEGRRYLDLLAGYSALNFGHRHPALIEAAHAQLDRLTLTSRAFHNDRLAEFAERLAELTGLDMVLPMNTGAEAVESGIKVARKWAYEVKGVPADRATIVVAADNFHGRTTTIVSFSTDETAREGFGPFTPGFRVVPYNDLAALEAAVDETTAAVLIEPIQGEAGVVIPDRRPRTHPAHRLPLHRRRDPVGTRPHGPDARRRARGSRPRPPPAGQGARRRHRAGVGGGRPPGRPRSTPAGRARLDVRRQPARRGGRHGGRRAAGDG